MSRSTPSLLALLGLVAVAGYQNRGKISDMLSDAQARAAAPRPPASPGGSGFLAEIGRIFQPASAADAQGTAAGGPVNTALDDLADRFKASGLGATANSWISHQENQAISVTDLETVLGAETLTELSDKTGLSRAELLSRLKVALPDVVNRLTPMGRLPTADEAQFIA